MFSLPAASLLLVPDSPKRLAKTIDEGDMNAPASLEGPQ